MMVGRAHARQPWRALDVVRIDRLHGFKVVLGGAIQLAIVKYIGDWSENPGINFRDLRPTGQAHHLEEDPRASPHAGSSDARTSLPGMKDPAVCL